MQVIDNDDTDIIDSEAKYLGCAITSIINLFDISTILLGGDIGYKGNILAGKISEILSSSTITKEKINVIPTSRKSGVLTAACTVIDNFFNERE